MYKENHAEFSSGIGFADEPVRFVLTLLTFVAVDFRIVEETFFALPCFHAVRFDLGEIPIVPLELNCREFTQIHTL